MSKLKVYLAGGMEAEASLGAGWRDLCSPDLYRAGFEVLNPCEFEPLQLKGLRPGLLPSSYKTDTGDTVYPKHWHELKQAPRGSRLYERFLVYMRRIIRFDIDVVENSADIVLCNWTRGTAKGAGTHAELTSAFLSGKPVYIVEHEESPIPAWALGCSTHIFKSMEDAVGAVIADFGT